MRDITDTAAALGTANVLDGMSALGALVVDSRRSTITRRPAPGSLGGGGPRLIGG